MEISELAGLRLFQNVPPESIGVYLERIETITVAAGSVIIDPSRQNTNVYCLVSGRLGIHLNAPDRSPHKVLEIGECVGEMSIIEHREPSACVIAIEESRLLKIDETTLWALINASHAIALNLLYILSGRVRHDNVVIADSSQILERFEKYAMIDGLTGLHNRRWMDDAFEREIRRCSVDDAAVSLAMVDVDHFKRFNDTFGHLAGDHALAVIASTLQRFLRPCDMLARYGGEEFALLFPRTGLAETLTIAERLRVKVERIHFGDFHGTTLPGLTISVGVAEKGSEITMAALIAAADRALYRAKGEGRNRVRG